VTQRRVFFFFFYISLWNWPELPWCSVSVEI
jgi:hypothetical protein